MSTRKAIYKLYAQAIPGAYAIDKRGTAPCKAACPAHISVQGYIALVAQGKFREALELIKEENPLPAICGRICHHPCETACTRGQVDEPAAINSIKRFVADLDLSSKTRFLPEIKEKNNEKIAIIGSGPAGLSCAYYLAKEGYRVTIYEKLPVPGGMLSVGIPEYRLPKDIIDAEVKIIQDMGVDIRTNMAVGKDITIDRLREDGNRAIFLGVGAHKSSRLGIEGEDLQGVYPGIDYLRDVNLGRKIELGSKVAVIGGGNVAMDAVRTALRNGSVEASVIYRRSLEEMPANQEEIEECEEEGIQIHTLTAPIRIIGENGKIKAIECIRMILGEPDESARRRPVPIEGSEHMIAVDSVIPAIGQTSDWSCLDPDSKCILSRRGTIDTDPVTYQTDDPAIFAGGDAATGPRTVIEAIEAGKQAAISIDRYARGIDLSEGRGTEIESIDHIPIEISDPIPRAQMPRIEPENRIDNFREVQLGFSEDQVMREAGRCLECGICSECYQCTSVCLADAVNHDEKVAEETIPVGSVILCPGTETYDPKRHYHYQDHSNVLTSGEFERILSATGPTLGHLIRPSDKNEPKKIAWLQCIGSRDVHIQDRGYCSSVCCTYAIKEAMVAKEHSPEPIDTAIFYIDIRTHGKDFEKYYIRGREESGIRFVRSRITHVIPVGDTGNLLIRYVDESGHRIEEEFDMVVLSVGLGVSPETVRLAKTVGIDTDQYGFACTRTFNPVETSRTGVFVCGAFEAPKDIPSSVMEASAAAGVVGGRLKDARWSLAKEKEIPDEIDVTQDPPRIGVFVCNCGTNIAGVVDVPAVVEYVASLPHVAFVDQNLFTCAQDTQEQIKEVIRDRQLNRIVVASCSPRTHEALFQETLQACGLSKYLFEMANIRDQNSWVHGHEPGAATEKARDLIRMAVARAATLRPLAEKTISVNKRALIVGGGVAGMNAALGLAEQGFESVIVEKETSLGGLSKEIIRTIDGTRVQPYLDDLIEAVSNHDKIQVLTNSLIVGFSGYKGNFTTEIVVGPGMYERKIDHGVVILATGANAYEPDEFLYGKDDRVMTQIELSRRLEADSADSLKNIVMIQCVGSRNDENPNCSRICCQTAVKNALRIRELNPTANIYILNRDIRTYGLLEDYYREAREKGILFPRFSEDEPPRVTTDEKGLMVTFRDMALQRNVRIDADLLVPSEGMRAEDTAELSSILKLARNEDGYFMEAHVKLRPVDMAGEGIFVCGTAHGPKLISEAITQAYAVTSRATTFLSREEITLSAVTARVDQDQCAACLACLRSCPHDVPRINEAGVSEIDEALCHGCGICAAECPAKAIELNWYEDEQIITKIDALLEGVL